MELYFLIVCLLKNRNILRNQIIFTTTLKTEEIGKYDKEEFKFVNHIDYSTHIPSSILNEGYLDYFKILLKEFIHDFN